MDVAAPSVYCRRPSANTCILPWLYGPLARSGTAETRKPGEDDSVLATPPLSWRPLPQVMAGCRLVTAVSTYVFTAACDGYNVLLVPRLVLVALFATFSGVKPNVTPWIAVST